MPRASAVTKEPSGTCRETVRLGEEKPGEKWEELMEKAVEHGGFKPVKRWRRRDIRKNASFRVQKRFVSVQIDFKKAVIERFFKGLRPVMLSVSGRH